MRDRTGETAGSDRAARADTGGEQAAADALHRFLTARPADRKRLAPRVVAVVGPERLDEIVEATLARVGEVTDVHDSPHGRVIEGTGGAGPRLRRYPRRP